MAKIRQMLLGSLALTFLMVIFPAWILNHRRFASFVSPVVGTPYQKPKDPGLYLVITYCDKSLDWIWDDYLANVTVKYAYIFTKCNVPLPDLPVPSASMSLPNLGGCEHANAHFMSLLINNDQFLSGIDDNAMVVFLKDSNNKYCGGLDRRVVFEEVKSKVPNDGFACIRTMNDWPKGWKFQGHLTNYFYMEWLGNFRMNNYKPQGGLKSGNISSKLGVSTGFKSPFRPYYKWANATEVPLEGDIVPVCFGGHFVTTVHQIRRITQEKKLNWTKIADSLTRNVNTEELHYMERSWAHILSNPLSDELKHYLREHQNGICKAQGSLYGMILLRDSLNLNDIKMSKKQKLLPVAEPMESPVSIQERLQNLWATINNFFSHGGQQRPNTESPGFVVLGMHRSGTAMLAGMLVLGAGYKTGGPLHEASPHNEKGTFEHMDIFQQNNMLFKSQGLKWKTRATFFDVDAALWGMETGKVKFEDGTRALKFFNDPLNAPWVMKDPRLCILLPVWLGKLNRKPAIVFTYRHPLEVSGSLLRCDPNFNFRLGLWNWYVYNRKAIENSADFCRVYTSNRQLLQEPYKEAQRISEELTSKCGVRSPPRGVQQHVVEEFVDRNIQHFSAEDVLSEEVLDDHDGCVVRKYNITHGVNTTKFALEMELYRMAMKIYCDLQTGGAFEEDYEWPIVPDEILRAIQMTK